MAGKKLEILLVEDSASDARLMGEALQDTGLPYRLNLAGTGADALEYLFRRGKYSDVLSPDIVLLDLNLPDQSGHEVLRQLKSEEATRMIPVIILSGSKADRDVTDAYDEHANCYVTKPNTVEDLFRVVRVIQSFWANVVARPACRG